MFVKVFGEIDTDDAASAGGKGASLGEMTRAGIPVPPGFVVLASAFERFLEETDVNVEIDAILHTVTHTEMHTVEHASEKIQALILGAKMPKDIASEIQKAFKGLGAEYVAVRSSATAEDSASAAWAGQLDSFLNTTERDMLKNVQRCWASLFTPRAIFYRFEKGLHDQKIGVAVVVQKMVESEVSGIAFSVHPVTEDRNQVIIEAGFGLGEAIVSGQITPDSYVVEKTPRRILDKNIEMQNYMLIRANKHIDGERNQKIVFSREKGGKQKLSDTQILELSELILDIENHYGFPCDIEWAFAKGKWYILQSRPITTLSAELPKREAPHLPIPKPFNGKDEWMLAENIPDADLFVFSMCFSSFVNDTSFPFLRMYKEVLADFHGFALDFYFGRKDSFEVAESILMALIERPDFGKEVNKNIVAWSKKLSAFAKKAASIDFNKLSNAELYSWYEKHDVVHTKLYTYGWLPVALDMFHNNFTDHLKSYLRTLCSPREAEEAFIVLTTPSKKTIIAREREEFLGIFKKHSSFFWSKSKNHSVSASIVRALEMHSKRWGHLGYIWAGNIKPFGPPHYMQEMNELVRSGITADVMLKKEEHQLLEAKRKKKALYMRLRIGPKYKRLFETGVEFALTKLVRRDAQMYTLLSLHGGLLAEIARRLSLTRQHVQFMLKEEVKTALSRGEADKSLLDKRLRECVGYFKKNFERAYVGSEADLFRKGLRMHVDASQTEFAGQVAQPGFAKGVVKIIIRSTDIRKMREGDILVSVATDPDIVPAMKKAAAIITEQGGITSHAAIVSRELGIPCIIGTKIATKVLKDGDMVEVDANRGIVKILQSRPITTLSRSATKTNREEGYAHISSDTYDFLWTVGFPYLYCSMYLESGYTAGDFIAINHGRVHTLFVSKDERKKLSEEGFKIFTTDFKTYTTRVKREHVLNESKIKKFFSVNLGDCSNEELAESFREAVSLCIKMWTDYFVLEYHSSDKVSQMLVGGGNGKEMETLRKNVDALAKLKLLERQSLNKTLYSPNIFDNYLTEIERRVALRFDIHNYSYHELIDALLGKDISLVPDRSGFVARGRFSEGRDIVGNDAEVVYRRLQEVPAQGQLIRGTPSTKGCYRGAVKLIHFSVDTDFVKEIQDMKEGEVLVSGSTGPELMLACKKAGAIVTDEGGIISHAAIVSRELGIPCVIGTKIATKVLKDGDMVEVDANKGIVRILQSRPITTLERSPNILERIIFKKSYSRDTTLFMQCVWMRALTDVAAEKFGKRNPYLPFIAHYVNDGVVEIWEHKEAMRWFFDSIFAKNNKGVEFLTQLLKEYKSNLQALSLLRKKDVLNTSNLPQFTELLSRAAFAVTVFLFTGTDERSPESAKAVALGGREVADFFADYDLLVRRAIAKRENIPQELAGIVLLGEITDIPNRKNLEARLHQYLLIDGKEVHRGPLQRFCERHPQYVFEESDTQESHELTGQTAYPGKVSGRVRIVLKRSDGSRVQDGDILVSPMTTPDFLPFMRKAAAFVTDEGGITCHAAIVSRELKKPCIIGTKIATKVLKDGDMVEVDANKGIVKILQSRPITTLKK